MAAPVNDNIADATDLGNDASGSVTGTNVEATSEISEPPILDDPDGYTTGEYGLFSVWWKWTAPGATTLGDWLALTDSSSNYGNGQQRLLRVTTVATIPADAIWTPMANSSDNRTDGTGYFQELDMFVGWPGLFETAGFGSDGQEYDHNDRFVMWVGTDADGTLEPHSAAGEIPAGTDLWFIASQWPDSGMLTDPVVNWDPTADMGTWTLSDGVTVLVPWLLADVQEYQVGPLVGTYQFNTIGSRDAATGQVLDTIFDVWVRAPDDSSWAFVDGNDDYYGAGHEPYNDISGGTTSRVVFDAVGGQQYYLRVTSYIGAESGPINLAWSLTDAPPVNDEITAATIIPSLQLTGNVSSDETHATAHETFAYTGAGHSVWWKWTAPLDGTMTLTALGSDWVTEQRIDVFTSAGTPDNTGASLTSVAGDGSGGGAPTVTFDAAGGTPYWFRMDTMDVTLVGTAVLRWVMVIDPPANDNRVDAATISGGSGTATYTTLGATAEDGEPGGVTALVGALESVWYSWDSAFTGTGILTANPTTLIDVYAVNHVSGGKWGADANVLGWQNGDIGGSGSGGASLAAVRAYLIATYLSGGLGPYGKFFDGGSGWHTAYTNFHGSGYGAAANEHHPVICAKTHSTSTFNTLMSDMAAALPLGETWYACFFSEPEDDFNAGTLTHSNYQSAWASMNTLRDAHPNGDQVLFMPILMAYQEISGSQHWADFLTPVLAIADAIGWDVYDDNGDPQSWSFATDILPAIQALATSSGLPWAIPEYGLQVSTHSGSTDTAAGVLARWEAMVAACEADPNFLWGNYWMDGPHAPNQRSAVIRNNPASADYLASIVSLGSGDSVLPTTADWADLVPVGGGLHTVGFGMRADEAYAIRLYPVHGAVPSISATLAWETSVGGGTGGGGGGGGGGGTGAIAMTMQVLIISTPGVLNASIIDETPSEELLFTIDGDSTVLVDDLVDDDGTWDGGIPLGELAEGDHYLTVTSGSRYGQVGFTVVNDVQYFTDSADPTGPALPTVVDGEWVAP